MMERHNKSENDQKEKEERVHTINLIKICYCNTYHFQQIALLNRLHSLAWFIVCRYICLFLGTYLH